MVEYTNSIILIVEGCFIAGKRGSHVRILDQIKFLQRNGFRVIVYSFSNHVDHPWRCEDIIRFRSEFDGVPLILDDLGKSAYIYTRIKNALYQICPPFAEYISWLSLPGTKFWKKLRSAKSSVFIFHFVDTLSLVNGRPSGRILVETHDIKSIKSAKATGLEPWHLRIIGKMRSEAAMISGADSYISISPADLAFFQHIVLNKNYFYIPSYSEEQTSTPPLYKMKYDMLFVGANNYFNSSGIVNFINRNSNLLTRFSLAIVGAVGLNEVVVSCASKNKNIQILGVVDDLIEVYACSKCVISPVEGTGLKIKVVEALANGKPVFGSVHSMDGLPPGGGQAVFECRSDLIEGLLLNDRALEAASNAAMSFYGKLIKTGDREKFLSFLKRAME
ncbi:glycosyltransferase [Methylobacterium pseudosasicola]|uniref:Glycosyltransferase involved in cell wall bisynthesis n=1 Tax=Methylobacterium pseudosasicola TaxID=582667 RepID=A0A1I4VKL0_9HYPH|nr:glycosyltransferase [Methylobacterium pseudosasicola]SFN01693.1 Glycosyltransferase involved in cell wall bisynthesis [Methylobacterium pseudosasicola]